MDLREAEALRAADRERQDAQRAADFAAARLARDEDRAAASLVRAQDLEASRSQANAFQQDVQRALHQSLLATQEAHATFRRPSANTRW